MPNAVKLEDVQITWQTVCPMTTWRRRRSKQRYGAGLTSLESALKRLDGLESEALQAEIERIKAEQAANRPAGFERLNIRLPSPEEPAAGQEGEA